MRSIAPTILVLAAAAKQYALAQAEGSQQQLSCASADVDSCNVPWPGGLFVFRQRFEPDVGGDFGSWGIDGLEVLDCVTHVPHNTSAYAPTYSHEQIGSFCLKSRLFNGEEGFNIAEGEWAQGEVGEGVEEVWERTWNTAGRFISTFNHKCFKRAAPGNGVPEFFVTLSKLHKTLTTAQLLSEADITPSDDTTYSLNELTSALSTGDYKPYVSCDNATLSSVHWPLLVRGKFDSGSFEAATFYEGVSNCPNEGIIYPPSTTLPKPTEVAEWDILRRPPPRPITLSHDESRMYYKKQSDKHDPQAKLGLFKDYEEGKEEEKEERAMRQFGRDEL
ncbi:hypothetical protein I316_01429 [Kwoniella heveanensis BCC8398]|uniref:Uncharacterized protein n=1 Tax=Kwoniella heveanensis BCC8398 TaxID=1296120 RepID=A0A1B9H0M0_9TREE|nr:hypothetical protein I316_01429 [Kwoniella heveanensis BCC8398]